jgi:CubicO group peptidase (beta-lactamase class C family)
MEVGLSGACEPRFSAVKAAFETNLRLGEDLGASVAVWHEGRPVVDLWGGHRLDGTLYDSTTLQLLYSVTKALTIASLMLLVENGKARLDAPVADCWPEFAAEGKGRLTLRELLGHRAGLVGFSAPVDIAALADWDRAVAMLAGQAPAWPLGSGHGYHALTFGFLAGEVVRRVSGESVGAFFQRHFAEPLGVELFIGLPEALASRVTPHFDAPGGYGTGAVLVEAIDDPGSPVHAAFTNPPIDTMSFNDPRSWTPELPAVNGIGSARALAALFSTMLDGPNRRFSQATIDDFRREVSSGPDFVLIEQPTRFGAGFMLPCPREPMLGRGSFGHNGRGGALVFADPEAGIAFAYVGNRLVHDPTPHCRLWRLLAALRDSL